MALTIRPEKQEDARAIHGLTALAFRDMPFADGDEQDVIDRLRSTGALTLSLVAVDDGEIVGQVTFSPAVNSDGSGPWFALGPVAVLPARQSQGIGSQLIREGLARITALGALGCILTGNPAYYQRFGFVAAPGNAPLVEPAEYFMLNLFRGRLPEGRFSFHPAFYGDTAG